MQMTLRLRKITKFVARCQILRLKCTKFDFGWGFTPDPNAGAYSAHRPPIAGFKGHTSREGEGRGYKGKGVDGRGGEGRGGAIFSPQYFCQLGGSGTCHAPAP